MIFPQINASVILFICFTIFASGATLLPDDEVEALRRIGNALGKTWNFDVDPCSGEGGWINSTENNLVNCSRVNNTQHIDTIILKGQNLNGTLPQELIRLPQLRQLDLTRNYLNGTIPREWGSMNLEKISLLGNRLTGPIPKELGNISTLSELVLEFNQLSGKIPPELGNLSSIHRLLLTSNNFTGELPEALAKLTTLKDFRIGDNHFTGNIPNFIQKWTNLEILKIQASGLDGPIPPGVANLKNLTDLRISDLNGPEQAFPRIDNASNLKKLILRSCNINGSLPKYLGTMKKLKTLDLSFNKLSGEIPGSFDALAHVDYVYLTGNSLSGRVPDWILNCKENIDISYNNFSSESLTCTQKPLNLFGSFSGGVMSGIEACNKRCLANQFRSYFHINCGGEDVNDGNIKYEADTDTRGASTLFLKTGSNWAYSSTGHFLDDNGNDNLTPEDTSKLFMKNSDLYATARLAPISLTYYGFCLENGNYTVKLHFAEIMFTDDNTYRSLGRRIFNIYIQGKLEQKDFNIEEKAGGVGKEFILNFSAPVTNNTLEIRFYWAGRGTTALPDRGVYGPLISAISVFDPEKQQSEHGNSTSVSTVVGIVVAVAFVIVLLAGILWWRGCLRSKKDTMERDLKGLDLQTGSFTLRQIKAATRNFDAANKIGEGGFGSVYKGLLSDGTIIAVKQLSSKSKQGNREFVNEIGMISALQHLNLVKLYGCCIEGNQLLLVYEYMENNSLARALFGPEEFQLKLNWPTRHKICIGIARGLAYLHEESRLKIVHRDIKATNVLLDKNLNPKISDFGLAKLDEEDDTHISTRIAGTYGYMAPEYAMWGYLTDKADVYSFGIVALEIISGKSAISYRTKENRFNLLDWTLALKEKGHLMDLVDPKLGPDFNREEVKVMIEIALLCTNTTPAVRPAMSSVVSALEGETDFQELLLFIPSDSHDEIELKKTNATASLIDDASADWPHPASSSCASDLYPITLNSDLLQKGD